EASRLASTAAAAAGSPAPPRANRDRRPKLRPPPSWRRCRRIARGSPSGGFDAVIRQVEREIMRLLGHAHERVLVQAEIFADGRGAAFRRADDEVIWFGHWTLSGRIVGLTFMLRRTII